MWGACTVTFYFKDQDFAMPSGTCINFSLLSSVNRHITNDPVLKNSGFVTNQGYFQFSKMGICSVASLILNVLILRFNSFSSVLQIFFVTFL